MNGFASGIGLVILVIVLLFTWLAVAVFVSPDLAAVMGLAVFGLWVAFFVPMGFIKELIWRARQKKIMDAAMQTGAAPYQAGTALPPPSAGGGASGSLVVTDQPGSGGALDLYRELPQLPQLEPRDHLAAFKRSLILPFCGIFMFIGAQNDTLIQALLEARGLAQKVAVNWEQIKLPAEYADHQDDMNRAARLLMRREIECGAVVRGKLAGMKQFVSPEAEAEQIANEEFVFEFECQGLGDKAIPFIAWVTQVELEQSNFSALSSFFSSHPPEDKAREQCLAAGNQALAVQGATLKFAAITPTAMRARSPSADYLRLVGNYRLVRPTGEGGLIGMSCWVGRETPASIRFTRPMGQLPN